MIEIQIPSRLYWPYRYHSVGAISELHWNTVNPELAEWIKKTCKGHFSVTERTRHYTEEERRAKPWRNKTTRVIETFALFSLQEDAALFKLFWL